MTVALVGVVLGVLMLILWRPMAAHLTREMESGSLPLGKVQAQIYGRGAPIFAVVLGGALALAAGIGLLAICSKL